MLSSVEKLQKFIKLEIERGYDNRAVVGGLDKILPSWETEARSNQLGEEVIQSVVASLSAYPGLDIPQREEELGRLLTQLEQVPAGGVTVVKTDSYAETETSRADSRPPLPKRQRPNFQQSSPANRGSNSRNYPNDPLGIKAPVRVLQGVGGRMSETLSSIGLNTLEDLLYYFPRRYDDYSKLKPINRLTYGEVTTLLATVQSIFARPMRGGKLQMVEAVVSDGTGSLRVNWFNQPWLAGKFSSGAQVVLSGKIDQYMGRPTMTNPEIEPIEADHLHTNRIVPVYALTARLNQKNLRRLMYQTVSYWAGRVNDYLPNIIRQNARLMDLSTALMNVHFPESAEMLDAARWRLAFDEIFLLQLGVLGQKRSWETAAAQSFAAPQEWLEQFIASLPFSLTGAQKRVIEEIRVDLASGRPMDRLVQGDVGSGKTVVAATAIAMIIREGAQAAVMAPTSILAEQHYRTLTRLLTAPTGAPQEEIDQAPLKPEEICLLVGDTSAAEKQAIREGLADGRIKVAIGTHALIEAPVQFNRLQLAVIDEQHRFGVSQRSALRLKGDNPHLLVMTATPIPRSLALTVYGDLDLSVMDELPAGRQPVGTHVLRPVERERAYHLIRAQAGQGHQAFIIYPRVEIGEQLEDAPDPDAPESDTPETEAENGGSRKAPVSAEQATALAAVEAHQHLQADIFKRLRLGLLHGRMKPEEKDQVMKDFRDHKYDVLVSTTVVEVGVDVPNATVMMIEGANRFGLAQLHQLRGRVGRGSVQSYCLLIPDKEDAVENERLAVMAETNDGFVLAERDLQQRGPGEFLGTRQAGFSELKMANLTDVHLIEKARQQAQALFLRDPDLAAPENQLLARKLQEFWTEGQGDIS